MKIEKIYHGLGRSCRCGCNGEYYYPNHKDFNYWLGEFTRLRDEQPDHYVSESVKSKLEEVKASKELGTVICVYSDKDHSNSFMNQLTPLK